jgi:maltoporin
MRMHAIKNAALALAAIGACQQGWALETKGYLRANQGFNSEGGGQACFGLAGAGSKYRLGNECGVYGELLLGQRIAGLDGAEVKGYAMLNLINDAASSNAKRPQGGWGIGLPQAYLAAEKLPQLNGASLWAGRRYYKREDLHITDYFYWNPSGLGLGIENVALGGMQLSYAFMHDDHQTMPTMRAGDTANRHDIQLRGLNANPGGSLEFGLALIHGNGDETSQHHHGGSMLTVQHRQSGLFGDGDNRLAIQYGSGAGADNGATGDTSSGSDVRRLRIVEGWYAQITPRLGGEAVAVWQRDTAHDRAKTKTWSSAGARISYGVAEHVKLLADIGHDRVAPDSGALRKLTKFTVAAALSAGPGYLSRPELRLFYTRARWNDAARAAAAAGDPLSATGLFGNATGASTVGITFETWW